MGRVTRENRPVARVRPAAKLVTKPLKPTLLKVIGVNVVRISSPTVIE